MRGRTTSSITNPPPLIQVTWAQHLPWNGRVIAPKKNRIIENMKVKKELQKAINSNIEEAMKARASQEPTSFKILKSSSGSEEKKKGSQK
ncbi:uncharacterized protein LOC143036930 isoform X2 [Oratosquilla oratoria]|uniref:uncharacterized protein LOC143036930 isoform X2 n=1 Tax=Oratosquilla oratoria TaxID=337810 RepID=UPI003F76719A